MSKKNKKTVKRPSSNKKRLWILLGFLIVLLIGGSIYYFTQLKEPSSTKEPSTKGMREQEFLKEEYKNLEANQILTYPITEETTLEAKTSGYKNGFNELSIVTKTGEKKEVVKTHSNLKFSKYLDPKVKEPTYDDYSIFLTDKKGNKYAAVYKFSYNESEELTLKQREKRFDFAVFQFDEKGKQKTVYTSNKVFVDFKKEKEELILEEKLYLTGYEELPSWYKPYMLYISKWNGTDFEEVEKKEVFPEVPKKL